MSCALYTINAILKISDSHGCLEMFNNEQDLPIIEAYILWMKNDCFNKTRSRCITSWWCSRIFQKVFFETSQCAEQKKSAKGKILKLRCLMQHPKTKEIIFRYFPPGFQLNVRFSNFTVLILQNLIDQKVSVFPWQIQRNPHNPSKLVTRIIVMIKLLEKCVTEIYFISGKTQPEVLA